MHRIQDETYALSSFARAGGTFFFTVNLADRSSRALVEHIDVLRRVVLKVQRAHPFEIVAMVVLPDHMHAVWTLPEHDTHYAMRWSLIKAGFSRQIPADEQQSASRVRKRERGIWQRRYWEHLIRDDEDLRRHVDYVHINPVKHGHVKRAVDWPFSTIHRYVRAGVLPVDWAAPAKYPEA